MMNRNSLKKKFGSNNSCEVIDSGSKDALNDNDISTAVEYVLSDVLEVSIFEIGSLRPLSMIFFH